MIVHFGQSASVWPALVQAISTGIIGLIAAGVGAYGVYVQRRKFDFDLFGHRYEFYSLFLRYKRATRSSKGVSVGLEREFNAELSRAKFLFPKRVSEIVLEVASLGDEYQDLREGKDSENDAVRRSALARRKEIRTRQDHLIEAFEKAVEKHLRFAR